MKLFYPLRDPIKETVFFIRKGSFDKKRLVKERPQKQAYLVLDVQVGNKKTASLQTNLLAIRFPTNSKQAYALKDFLKKANMEEESDKVLVATEEKEARFEKGKKMKITDPRLPKEFVEMNQNPPPEVLKVREEMKKKAGVPSGKYGFTRGIETGAESLIRKVARLAETIAKKYYKKDPSIIQFLSIHAKRDGSQAAKILLAECKDLIPKIASSREIASTREKSASLGLYNLPEKVVHLGLMACIEFREGVGKIVSDYYNNKSEKYADIYKYLLEHKKQSKCKTTSFLLSACPEPQIGKLASQHLGSGNLFWEND